tara:strand:- start:139 stop:396 length:258 start_codon:yes stop_codon:yes gene_type:complete
MARYCCEAGGTHHMEQTTEWVSGEGMLSSVNQVWFCHNCGSIWLREKDEWPKTEPARWNLWFKAKQRRQQTTRKKAMSQQILVNL